MTEMDTWIGQNVERLRATAEMKQADVAAKMTEQGFKWSQRTVWAVEKGERPLRLAEAEVLGRLLGGGTAQLVTPPEAAQIVNEIFDAAARCNGAIEELQNGLEMADSAYSVSQGVLMTMDQTNSDLDAVREVIPEAVVGRYTWALKKVRKYGNGGIAAFVSDAQEQFAVRRGWKVTGNDEED